MGTEATIYYTPEHDIHLYEEAMFGNGVSPAYIQVSSGRFLINHYFGDKQPKVAIEIPPEVMDRIATEWLRMRKIEPPAG